MLSINECGVRRIRQWVVGAIGAAGLSVVTAGAASASIVEVELDSAISVPSVGLPVTVTFDEAVEMAFDLLAITDGNFSTAGGGFYAVSVLFEGGGQAVVVDEAFVSGGSTVNFADIMDFPNFVAMTVVGLIFEIDTSLEPNPMDVSLLLPAGTIFRFDVPDPMVPVDPIPLPGALVFGLTGLLGLGGARRMARR